MGSWRGGRAATRTCSVWSIPIDSTPSGSAREGWPGFAAGRSAGCSRSGRQPLRVVVAGVVLGVASRFAGLFPHQESVHQVLEIAFEDAVDVADGEARAQVLDHAIGRQDVAADLAAEVDGGFGVLDLLLGGAALLHLVFIQTGAQLFHRRVAGVR